MQDETGPTTAVVPALQPAPACVPAVLQTADSNDGLRQTHLRLMATNKQAILAAMAAAGIQNATASYSGEGDDGQPVEVTAMAEGHMPASDVEVPVVALNASWDRETRLWSYTEDTVMEPLATAIERFVDALIDVHHSGYENGDGGGGDVTFDTTDGTVIYEKYDLYVERDSAILEV